MCFVYAEVKALVMCRCCGEHQLLTHGRNIESPKGKKKAHPAFPCASFSKGITLKLMETEAGFILRGISLSGLKAEQQHLNSTHCLRAGSLELDPGSTAALSPPSDRQSARVTSNEPLFNPL